MRAILVDDEAIMLRSFMRNCDGIPELNVVAQFQSSEDALAYAKDNAFELALLDICLPEMNGIELAGKLREIYPNLLIVFISAYDEYIRDFNEVGGDYYIVKPYKKSTIENMMEKMLLLSGRQKKEIYIQMFGRFNVLKNGQPLKLAGKTKEILALIASKCGREVSNEEIYSTIWENREYSNERMKVYYNALSRLKRILEEAEVSELLISTKRGQMLNTTICDCDYFDWKNKKHTFGGQFEGEFLSEYSWGEVILADILEQNMN